jgi:hypothetical protein
VLVAIVAATPIPLYRIWSGDDVGLWLVLIVATQVLFFTIFGRDASTR